jgi:hypothetical protein
MKSTVWQGKNRRNLTQLHGRNLCLIKQITHQQAFFTPVELEGLAVFKEKRYPSLGGYL